MTERPIRAVRIAIPMILIFTTFSIGLFALWVGTGASKKNMPIPVIAFLFLMVATPVLSLILAIRGHTKELLLVLGIGGSALVGMLIWAFVAMVHS